MPRANIRKDVLNAQKVMKRKMNSRNLLCFSMKVLLVSNLINVAETERFWGFQNASSSLTSLIVNKRRSRTAIFSVEGEQK